jgi:hypothetical protein
MGEVVRASRLRSALERLGSALDPERHREREQVRDLLKHLRELRVENERRADAVAVRLDAIGHAAEALRQDAASSRRALERTRRDALRQRALVNRLLHRSGVDQRSAEVEERVTARLARIARSRLPVIVGPWTGEVGFELLYWIPFLQWVRETFPIDPARMIVVSRGGVSSWYGHVAGAYDDIFATETPDAFRAATEDRKKQKRIRTFDRRVVRTVMRARGIRQAYLLHPTLMYGLFNSFWRYAATVKRLEEFARFRRLPAVAGVLDGRAALPDRYVAVRFYFSDCFPDTSDNRAFATHVVDGLAARGDVVLLNSDLVVDDHRDFGFARNGRVHMLSPHMRPEDNLALQTAAIAGATAFVGTYGGYSYLAPLCGVSSVAFFSRQTFKQHHLELAHRAFQRLGGAQLSPVDVQRAQPLADALAGLSGAAGIDTGVRF